MRKNFVVCVAGLVASGALLSCTQLEVRKHDVDDAASYVGFSYFLDYTQFNIVLTRTLVACNGADAPTIKIEADVRSELVPDGEHIYVIDPQSMISAFKISSISSDFESGRLTAFNSSATDKTADLIKSIAVISGKIALISAGIPLPVSADPDFQYCSAEAIRKLKIVKNNKGPLEKATADIEEANKTLTTLAAQYAAAPTKKLQNDITATTAAIKLAKTNLESLTKESAKAQEWLTDSRAIVWPESGQEFETNKPSFALSIATVGKWFDTSAIREKLQDDYAPSIVSRGGVEVLRNDADVDGDGNAARLGITAEQFSNRYPRLSTPFDVHKCPDADSCAQLSRLAADLLEPNKERIDSEYRRLTTFAALSMHLVRRGTYGSTSARAGGESAEDGLRYRVPASGYLYICEYPQPCHSGESGNEPVAKVQSSIAQLGTVFNIPFSSPLFASGSIEVKFDKEGRLSHAALVRENSAASDLANAGESLVNQAAAVKQAKRNETLEDLKRKTDIAIAQNKLAEAEKALKENPVDKLGEELKILELQEKIDSARTSLAPSRVKDLNKELEIAKIEAQLAETRERYATDPHADLVELKEQYDAHTALLNARKANLEAEVAVRNAERALDN